MIHTSLQTLCRADTNIKHCTGMLCPTPSSLTVQLMQLVQLDESPGCGCEGRRDRRRRRRGLRVSGMGVGLRWWWWWWGYRTGLSSGKHITFYHNRVHQETTCSHIALLSRRVPSDTLSHSSFTNTHAHTSQPGSRTANTLQDDI